MAIEIIWYGRSCFRIRGREGVVVTDPVPADSGHKLPKLTANVVTLSNFEDPGTSNVKAIGDDPRVFDAPGEYEVGGVLIEGVPMPRAADGRNMGFIIEIEAVKVGHLGLPDPAGFRIPEAFSDVDVLLIPAGGGSSLQPTQAADLITSLDPPVAIPMYYKTDREKLDLEPITHFLRESGAKSEPQPRFQVTKAGLPSELSIVVLEPKT